MASVEFLLNVSEVAAPQAASGAEHSLLPKQRRETKNSTNSRAPWRQIRQWDRDGTLLFTWEASGVSPTAGFLNVLLSQQTLNLRSLSR